jgi:hypothetical protein
MRTSNASVTMTSQPEAQQGEAPIPDASRWGGTFRSTVDPYEKSRRPQEDGAGRRPFGDER